MHVNTYFHPLNYKKINRSEIGIKYNGIRSDSMNKCKTNGRDSMLPKDKGVNRKRLFMFIPLMVDY